MAESARALLAKARTLYDNPKQPLAAYAEREAWKSGFTSGAEWMRLALGQLRGGPPPCGAAPFQKLGVLKYSLASAGALIYALVVAQAGLWLLLPGAAFVFYAIEAQMVFLFPLALDGCPAPVRASLAWTRRAGGTVPVMLTVMQLAAVMLFGGVFGRGFIRCWCLGCLSVLLWYEEVRNA
jgi:hypothetical protein